MRYYGEVLIELILSLPGIWLIFFVSIMIHELGHAMMYRVFFKDGKWHVFLGVRKVLLQTEKFTIRSLPIYGYFHIESPQKGSKLQWSMMYLGGPFLSLLTFVVFQLLVNYLKRQGLTSPSYLLWFIRFMAVFNFYQFLFSIIPLTYPTWPYKGMPSDGKRILNMYKAMKRK